MNPFRYLTGSPVYRAASNAPTRGTVDPMGYINRSLGVSPVGGDGLSDKRSGIAQAALNRLRGGPPQQQSPQQSPQVPNNKSFTVSATGQLIPISASPQEPVMPPDPAQVMQAARDRLQHHFQVKEMTTKHQINMQNLMLKHADTINKHRGY